MYYSADNLSCGRSIDKISMTINFIEAPGGCDKSILYTIRLD